MISGAMRGKGGDALAHHLLKPENESVEVIPARGLGSPDLVGQVRELVALSMGGRTDKPVYHVHADPDLEIADNDGARARFWSLFEQEFGLGSQPVCGAIHVKHGRRHEHRVYSLVRPSGAVVDVGFDFARRERVARVVEFEFGMPGPTASKHARAITRALREGGRGDVADWIEAAGATEAERPVARLSPTERLIQERTGIPLDDLRAAALEAWRVSDDGDSFLAALRKRGLDLREGRSGAVVVDRSGTAHLATRLVGAAARREGGTRIPAAAVKARLSGLTLKQHQGDDHGKVGSDHRGAGRAEAAPGGLDHSLGAGRGAGGAVPVGRSGGPDDRGGRPVGSGVSDALARIAARPGAARLRARMRLLGPHRSAALAAGLDAVRAGRWVTVPGQHLDIWGLPIGERPRLG